MHAYLLLLYFTWCFIAYMIYKRDFSAYWQALKRTNKTD